MCHIPKVSLLPISRESKGDLGESSERQSETESWRLASVFNFQVISIEKVRQICF